MTDGMVTIGQSVRGRDLAFAFAVSLLAVVFIFLIPLLTYLCVTILRVHGMQIPDGTAALIAVSPWLPIVIAASAIGLLSWTRGSGPAKIGTSLAAIAFVIVVGGLWLLAMLVPTLSLMFALTK